MSTFSIKIKHSNLVTVIRTSGYFDAAAGKVLKDECSKLFDAGKVCLVFNFEETPLINSLGLSALLNIIIEAVDYKNGIIALTGLTKLTKDALNMVGAMSIAEAFQSESEAISSLIKQVSS